MKVKNTKDVDTYWAEICIAGDYQEAKSALRKYTIDNKLCVTLTKTDFIYTGGAEEGVLIRIVNYPRFPKDYHSINVISWDLAKYLMEELSQLTALVVTPHTTHWFNNRYDN